MLIDDNEAVFNGKQTSDLGIRKGGNSTQDIVDMYKGGILGSSLRSALSNNKTSQPVIRMESNKALISEMKKIASNTHPSNQKGDSTTFDVITGMLQHDKKKGGKRRYYVRK